MRFQLVVIAGPTGVGKTDRAIELARKFDAPIVVLDRVQCHAELAVGSGRSHADQSRQRIFLDERRVADGTISAPAAYRRLCQISGTSPGWSGESDGPARSVRWPRQAT